MLAGFGMPGAFVELDGRWHFGGLVQWALVTVTCALLYSLLAHNMMQRIINQHVPTATIGTQHKER